MQLLDLALLQTTTGYPCVSVLARRRPNLVEHRNALAALIAEADRRLHLELGPRPSAHLVDRLHTLAGVDVDRTARSVAIFVGASLDKVYPLPVDVHDRVIIDDSFATRDLVRTHHHTTYLLVTADATSITLYDGNGPTLTPISRLPITAPTDLTRMIGGLDHAIDRATSSGAPILLAAPANRIDDIRTRTRHHITSTITTPATSPSSLAAAVAPALAELRASHQTQTLHDLRDATLITGIRDVWRALHHARVDLLVVEHSYRAAGRHRDGDLHLVEDPTAPDVIDDLVDDAVEAAMAQRSRVEFVPDDTLQHHCGCRIAARLHTADR